MLKLLDAVEGQFFCDVVEIYQLQNYVFVFFNI